MTSSVIVTAHCGDTKEVEIELVDNATGDVVEEFTLQNAEAATRHVYDDLTLTVKEVLKSEQT